MAIFDIVLFVLYGLAGATVLLIGVRISKLIWTLFAIGGMYFVLQIINATLMPDYSFLDPYVEWLMQYVPIDQWIDSFFGDQDVL
ncbi:MAG: hypothetical protein ACR2PW_02935 [Gammaproteobacteria bacterium]